MALHMMPTPARLRRFSQAAEHDVPPLQLVPSGRKPFIAAESGMGLVSLRITARPALGQVEILNVNISTSLGAYRRKAQRAKIVILEILGRLSRNDLWQT